MIKPSGPFSTSQSSGQSFSRLSSPPTTGMAPEHKVLHRSQDDDDGLRVVNVEQISTFIDNVAVCAISCFEVFTFLSIHSER
jgi:hypothetical protein